MRRRGREIGREKGGKREIGEGGNIKREKIQEATLPEVSLHMPAAVPDEVDHE